MPIHLLSVPVFVAITIPVQYLRFAWLKLSELSQTGYVEKQREHLDLGFGIGRVFNL